VKASPAERFLHITLAEPVLPETAEGRTCRRSHAHAASYCRLATLTLVASCAADSPTATPDVVGTGVRVINGHDAPVDVVIDGVVARAGLAAGEFASVGAAAGNRILQVRVADGTAVALAVRVGSGRLSSVAATRAGSSTLALQSLDDTNTVVPSGATKLRVLHLASRAGEVQVWRTQLDIRPGSLGLPFNHNAVNNGTPREALTYTASYRATPGWPRPTRVVSALAVAR
jgi:hypothetical protein